MIREENMKLRLLAAAAISFVIFAGAPASAQQKPLTPAEITKIKSEVSDALQYYAKVFGERDINAVVDKVMANPEVVLSPTGPQVMPPDKVRDQYTKTFAALPENYVRSDWPKVTVCVLRPTLAIASGSFKRIAKDGSTLTEGHSAYLFGKYGDSWKLISTLGGQPNKVVTCD
jgi:ketosteroid isomerase-like protein